MGQLWGYIKGLFVAPISVEELMPQLLDVLTYDPQSPRTLAGGLFLLMFLVFGVGYLAVRGVAWLRTLYVTAFSLYFYYKLSGLYLLLLIAVALSDFTIGWLVAYSRKRGHNGSGWVALSVIINVSILTYFKAANMVIEWLQSIYDSGVLELQAVVIPAGVSSSSFSR